MIQRDESKSAESPEDEGVGETRQRALPDDFGLAHHLPDEVPDTIADREEAKIRVFPGAQDVTQDGAEAACEECGRGRSDCEEEKSLSWSEGSGFGQCGEWESHIAIEPTIQDGGPERRFVESGKSPAGSLPWMKGAGRMEWKESGGALADGGAAAGSAVGSLEETGLLVKLCRERDKSFGGTRGFFRAFG